MKNKIKFIKYITIIFLINITFEEIKAENSIYELEAIKIKYENNLDTIIAEGKASAKDQFGREILSDVIIYEKSKSKIKTKSNSIYNDDKGNKITADEFLYDLQLKKIEAKKNVKYIEKNGSIFNFSYFEYYEDLEKGFGKKLNAKLIDESSIEGEVSEIDNIKGLTVIKNSNDENKDSKFLKFLSIFKNYDSFNNYTPCKDNSDSKKSIKDRCPDWSLSTSKTTHDKINKMVHHENAVLKIKNFPVFYTPYFSHPDPTVKRKSGFLMPTTKNFSDLGRTIKTPYYWVIDESSDFTFTPIFYLDENSIFLTEYRKQNKDSMLLAESSYTKGYKNLNKKSSSGKSLNRTGGSRSHLFAKFLGSYEDLLFSNNDLEINIQRISQKNYFDVNQINTFLVKEGIRSLNNNFIINSYENNKRIKISANIYENLKNDDPNTKYQYVIPTIQYNDFFKKFNQNIGFSSFFESSNFDGDSKQTKQFNIFDISTEKKIIKSFGISNIFKTKLSNINIYNDNVLNEKDNLNNDINTIYALESSLPMIKLHENTEEILSPKIFTKYSPGSMSNVKENNKILNYSDVYAMDRLNSDTNPETGASIGYGIDYNFNKKNINENIYLSSSFSIGQIYKEKNDNLPISSSLNEKSSDIVGAISFFLDKNKHVNKKDLENTKNDTVFDINYNFNISNNLNSFLRNELDLSLDNNKNSFKAKYYELNEIGNTQYLELAYKRAFSNNFNLELGGRKNLETDFTENNSIELNYDTDCIKFGVNLSNKFYQRDDVQKTNNLTLFLTLKPFGQPIAPDLTNLINN